MVKPTNVELIVRIFAFEEQFVATKDRRLEFKVYGQVRVWVSSEVASIVEHSSMARWATLDSHLRAWYSDLRPAIK
jgi:hypothetical protein